MVNRTFDKTLGGRRKKDQLAHARSQAVPVARTAEALREKAAALHKRQEEIASRSKPGGDA